MQALVFARTGSSAAAKLPSPLMFTSGAPAELANIMTDRWTYELSVHSAPKSLKGAALAITSSGK
jgi:hypothetical protein